MLLSRIRPAVTLPDQSEFSLLASGKKPVKGTPRHSEAQEEGFVVSRPPRACAQSTPASAGPAPASGQIEGVTAVIAVVAELTTSVPVCGP